MDDDHGAIYVPCVSTARKPGTLGFLAIHLEWSNPMKGKSKPKRKTKKPKPKPGY